MSYEDDVSKTSGWQIVPVFAGDSREACGLE